MNPMRPRNGAGRRTSSAKGEGGEAPTGAGTDRRTPGPPCGRACPISGWDAGPDVNLFCNRTERERIDADAVGVDQGIDDDIERLCLCLLEFNEGGLDVRTTADFQQIDVEAERGGRCLNLGSLPRSAGG